MSAYTLWEEERWRDDLREHARLLLCLCLVGPSFGPSGPSVGASPQTRHDRDPSVERRGSAARVGG